MNNLSGSTAELKLYAYGADGTLAEAVSYTHLDRRHIMTRVYFVRHAQPEHDWEEDRTRPLTEKGRKIQ